MTKRTNKLNLASRTGRAALDAVDKARLSSNLSQTEIERKIGGAVLRVIAEELTLDDVVIVKRERVERLIEYVTADLEARTAVEANAWRIEHAMRTQRAAAAVHPDDLLPPPEHIVPRIHQQSLTTMLRDFLNRDFVQRCTDRCEVVIGKTRSNRIVPGTSKAIVLVVLDEMMKTFRKEED